MTRPLWTGAELIAATGGTLDRSFDATGVSIDTRTVQPGDLFIALQGEGRDGHDFVAQALANGAAGAMVHRDPGADMGPDAALLRVDDTLAALARLGGFARNRFAGRLVAVTGSVGKTTTKEMLRAVLGAFGPTHAAVASYNNHWGLPLTLARTPLAADWCIAEIGMNHAGEIAPLAALARPHVAVITTVEKAHIGYLGSIETIADEKAAIMTGLEPGGVAVLPLDNPQFGRLRAAAGTRRVVTFGGASTADIRLAAIDQDANGSVIVADVAGQSVRVRLQAPGRHMAMNALAALAAVSALGLDPVVAGAALEGFHPIAGRGLRRQVALGAGEASGSAMLLDESYNGNGASIRAALEVLRLQPTARRIAVLGDMLELGDEGPAEHAALAADVIRSANVLFACGPLMRHLFDAVPPQIRGVHAPEAAALAPHVAAALLPGDAILVKGSLGSRMRHVVQAIDALATNASSDDQSGTAVARAGSLAASARLHTTSAGEGA
jgi:UDP-N-acetylmuramoyl-tripeptide--D-alanyl-D-alanine ligase